jgi:hypothetical protein
LKRFENMTTPTVRFRASDVTRTRDLPVEVQGGLPAGAVARSLARRMNLPDDVPWALRDDSSCLVLDEGRSIGEQLGPDARLTVTPKTHLG